MSSGGQLPGDSPGLGFTTAFYKAKWLGFQFLCKYRRVDPWLCTFKSVISFLQCLLDRRLAHVTIKLYAVASSSCHEGFGYRRVFSHPMVKSFLQGIKRQ